ncbi:aromatic ring-opening dioxygenase subunit LigA [Novosphingobium sp. MMS21-SN21R]|uniref:aromatic ring-opening dioxygenase subunit LigA n=1 Tax=Novosphingobium sp. MMS21-SN21R TaxID=2969298 RepID=UPI002887BDAB|nr:aromatic ring-opening dioxygenase subunit LigA [Novosphingobium sp. MMS21-SN21R]MDT0510226.1 aromatic ring-opening dioxygenase subunit LigA [Novosphingobium sp. MMS21-SN21R]
MSLYHLSKLIYVLNKADDAKRQWRGSPEKLADRFALDPEERDAVLNHDIGLIYVLGVNGQLLMHFAALCGIEWSDYLRLMREGVEKYGPVRAGLYAMTTAMDEKVAGL